jgi:hypothetical protein
MRETRPSGLTRGEAAARLLSYSTVKRISCEPDLTIASQDCGFGNEMHLPSAANGRGSERNVQAGAGKSAGKRAKCGGLCGLDRSVAQKRPEKVRRTRQGAGDYRWGLAKGGKVAFIFND